MPLTQVDQGLLGQYAQYTGFKNRIINGAMMIDQRNAGASVTPSSNGQYTLDRWFAQINPTNKFSTQQSSTAPSGFTNSLLVTSLSAYSVAAGEYQVLSQAIEGYNVSDLGWGTANAKSVTLSFWVQSSLTGTFGGSIQSAGQARSYPFSYTISSANTWTNISVVIPGDGVAGAGNYNTTNGVGLYVKFGLGVGSTFSGTAGSWGSTLYLSATGATSVVGTNGATFYITGVQLEKGSTATSFDYRPYGTELALCQRYYELVDMNTFGANGIPGPGITGGGNRYYSNFTWAVQKRATPTINTLSGSVWQYYNAGSWTSGTDNGLSATPTHWQLGVQGNTNTGTSIRPNGANQNIYGSAEL